MPNTALNRSGVAILTNKSGSSVAYGATVILDSTTAESFTTTTTANQEDDLVGVVLEPNGIANNASGLVATSGFVPKITLASSASLGDYLYTHTVAGQAQRSGTKSAGAFGQVLGTGTTPKALLFGGLPKQTTSGISAAGTLWYPRAAPASPSATDDEFADNSGGVPSGWTEVDHGNVTTVAEAADGLRLTQSTHANNSISGIYKAIPAGDFSIWAELAIYAAATGASQMAITALCLFEDATNSAAKMALLYLGYAASNIPEFAVGTVTAYNSGISGLASVSGNRITVPPRGFLRIRRTSTTYTFDISHDGIGAYRLYNTAALGFTPTHFGIVVSNLNSGADIRGVASFFRYTASDIGILAPWEGRRVNYYA